MKVRVSMTCILVFLSLYFVSYSQDSLKDIQWILGDWKTSSERTTEKWIAVSDSTFEGVGKTITDRGVSLESLRLVRMSGDIFLIAKVSHNPFPVSFRLIKHSEQSALFENKTHDFPTFIRYSHSNDTLSVNVGNKTKSFTVHFLKH